MHTNNLKIKAIVLSCFFSCTTLMGCKKLIEIDEPINTITSTTVFSTDALATSAMSGIYSEMINGNSPSSAAIANSSIFSAGLTTSISGLSSDELYVTLGTGSVGLYPYNTNQLTALNAGASVNIWTSAYSTIYKANAVIEGIAASKSANLHEQVRNELTGEAKFIRAFSYFYLTNFFGDVPMALTINFNKTATLPRMPQQQVYQQIIADLKDAQSLLSTDYSAGMNERIIPNKWAATLLLARVYLYTGNNSSAIAQATSVINNSSLYSLEQNVNDVFLTSSREAIWQLKQTNNDFSLKNATQEGLNFLPNPLSNGYATYGLTTQLLNAFETGDKRRTAWVGSTTYSSVPSATGMIYYPYKYKIGSSNANASAPPMEYSMVLRFAEAYLIRAEANGILGNTAVAITDLNLIRRRAGLPDLNGNLDQAQVKSAVSKERQTEFFAEWGHRWFDLKRTGQAISVLSAIPLKQPWAGDYQLLHPIPPTELMADKFLTQNPGY